MSCNHTPSLIHLVPHTPHHRTTPKQPDRQRISKSAHSSHSPTIFQVNVNATVPRPSKRTTILQKKPDTPHANDNTSSRTAHPPQKAASMPQTSKSIAKPQAKAHEQTQTPQFTRFLSMPMQTGHHLQDTCQ